MFNLRFDGYTHNIRVVLQKRIKEEADAGVVMDHALHGVDLAGIDQNIGNNTEPVKAASDGVVLNGVRVVHDQRLGSQLFQRHRLPPCQRVGRVYRSYEMIPPDAYRMEKLLEDGINAIGLGPQGMGGKYSVMGVNIENTARHPSTIGVAVNVGCWSHRRGHIVVDKDLNVTCDTHSTWKFNG